MNVSNRKCVRRLSIQSMRAAKLRNGIAICAIALTTLLFTSLFTIALSISYSFEQANFRQAGGYSHGVFKYLTKEQFDELSTDPLIKEYGIRRYAGMPDAVPFNKSHVEVSYCDPNAARWMFIDPKEGRLPAEGTNEAATDTAVLALLGVEPELGAKFTMTFQVDGVPVTETFTLCGWWEYDEAIVANHVLIPKSRTEEIFEKLNTKGIDGITSTYSMDVMFSDSINIEKNMDAVLSSHGYQDDSPSSGDSYISTGINWGYTSSQLSDSIDPLTVVSIAALLLLIIFTGYLIIYNVFQISVSNDIRFYGLLKTIGTTGRQLRRIIRMQAFFLSLAGIPLGLLAGYLAGTILTPIILSQLNGVAMDAVSANPLIFIGSTLFSLFTVLLSCHKPGRMAGRVSPVEAIRYTDGSKKTKRSGSDTAKQKKKTHMKNRHSCNTKKGSSLTKMAWANLGRNRSKTIVTIISLTLAVVMLNMTVTFTSGFDLDKYLKNVVSDFVLANAGYFQTGHTWNAQMAVEDEVIHLLDEQDGITNAGRIYGSYSPVMEFVTEDYYRSMRSYWPNADVDHAVSLEERNENGLLSNQALLYGMEPYALDKLTVLEGDTSKLYEPEGNYIAAVYLKDDYDNPIIDSHWAQLGDTITLRYVDEFEYFDTDTGEKLDPDSIQEGMNYGRRVKAYHEISYEVAALVLVPHTLSYRYYGIDQFILNDRTFIRDTGTDSVMLYAFDASDESSAALETFLSDLTKNQMPQFDYESKETYAAEFDSFHNMFLLLGGMLSFIVGLVGILNFLNAVLTGILTRRREFAVLQSIGMTGRQLKTMLVWEGIYYALGSIVLSLLLSILTGPLLSNVLGGIFWFFTYRFTVLPVLCAAPFFALLGAGLPIITYRFVSRHSIVERLHESE